MGGRFKGNSHDLAVHASQLNGGAVTTCDYSGFLVHKADVVAQMAYNGQGLFDTGFRVHKAFADTPNPQTLNPPMINDPYPVIGAIRDNQSLNNPLVPETLINIHHDDQGEVRPNPFDLNTWTPTAMMVFTEDADGPWMRKFEVRFINTFFQMFFENRTQSEVILSIQGAPYRFYRLEPFEKPVCIGYNMVDFFTVA